MLQHAMTMGILPRPFRTSRVYEAQLRTLDAVTGRTESSMHVTRRSPTRKVLQALYVGEDNESPRSTCIFIVVYQDVGENHLPNKLTEYTACDF